MCDEVVRFLRGVCVCVCVFEALWRLAFLMWGKKRRLSLQKRVFWVGSG